MGFQYLVIILLAISAKMGEPRTLGTEKELQDDDNEISVSQDINAGNEPPSWQAQFDIGKACSSHEDCPEACYVARKPSTCGPWLY